MSVVNIAAYRFVPLTALPALKMQLAAQACALKLKGTVLLAEEGINLFLAGSAEGIEQFLDALMADARFAGMPIKRSVSDTQPFKKLLVKVKPEIITLRQPEVNPALTPAPSVTPQTLKHWLDQGHDDTGKPLVLLDTRNTFEFEHGSFNGAVHPHIEKFSDYPTALPAMGDLSGKTIVTFCTGGIRCEKAAPWMLQAGYENVVQLEGGILNYFEHCGSAHYTGGCFVFDERRALDGDLQVIP